ncbi:MAG: polysaccharide deacetylase family protein, partial [Alphaproteobacteria bacterium]|nr:polysaccharide deacetylase family protein [Alphaproteobacteria bacterium]
FTLDDGYRDNIDHAYPVFKRHNVPFTIYLPTAFADGEGELWWLVLEESILKAGKISVTIDGSLRTFRTKTTQEKDAAFDVIYWWLRSLPERQARHIVRELAEQTGYDASPLCADLVMTWDEARSLAADPLVTFGGHTCRHLALAKLPKEEARCEVAESISRLERELGRPCRHFSYPYGDEGSASEREFELVAALGLATAVTTRKGHVHDFHANQITALPRVSLNGGYQDLRFVSLFLTGVPFVLWNALGRVRAVLARIANTGLRNLAPSKLPTR